jgi:hypothetical protein
MLGFPHTLRAVTLMLTSVFSLDLPIVSPVAQAQRAAPPEQTIEELTASRVWVPASKIPILEGRLDLRVFPEGQSNMVEGLLRNQGAEQGAGSRGVSLIPRSTCTTRLDLAHDFFAGGWTFDEMLKDSTGIYSGIIVGEEPGFVSAVPTLHLRLKIENIILAAPGFHGDFLDIFYPHAQFAIHGHKVCGIKDDGGFDPTIGDRVLVFAARPFPELGTPAWMPAPERIALESAGGTLYLPNALRLDRRLFAVENLSQMEDALRHALKTRAEVKP